MSAFRTILTIILCAALIAPVSAEEEEPYNDGKWRENEVALPAAPTAEGLHKFFVSAASENAFFVDLATLDVGSDGVVRYTLVVESPQGGRTVTYEGMRCETRERRIYAVGRRDGAWSKSRNESWSKIKDVPANRAQAALFLEYFCPGGVIVRDVREASDALRQGVHPDNRRW